MSCRNRCKNILYFVCGHFLPFVSSKPIDRLPINEEHIGNITGWKGVNNIKSSQCSHPGHNSPFGVLLQKLITFTTLQARG